MGKNIQNISDSKIINENLQSIVECPECKGKNSQCSLCKGVGKVSKQKIKNLKK